MPPPAFAHLHVHSHYSLLDGVAQIPDLVKQAKNLGMDSLAITDHGNMFGAIEFYLAAKKAGVHPVLGMEAYIAPGARTHKSAAAGQDPYCHLILLAENYEGYQNLSRLSSTAFIDGFYHKPRIDKEVLAQYSKGLICSSACLAGEVNQHLLNNHYDRALRAAGEFKDIFGPDRFFLEVMRNGLPEQEVIIPALRRLSAETGLALLPTSDVHYVRAGDEKLQDILICIGTVKLLADENRMRGMPDLHLKSPEEMERAFPGPEWREALELTAEIARRCQVEIAFPTPETGFHLPVLKPPEGMTNVEYFDQLCREGLAKRYGAPLPDAVVARYEMEKGVIIQMGFPDYFLIVWDVVNFAHKNGIWVGPGRGSAAGSIVAYALGITNMDPLAYDLLFERFLNVGRVEMPDIDLDFDKERRQEVVQHIIDTHSKERCAKIVTFGTIQLKSGLRDVGRVLGVPLSEVNGLAKLLPDMLKPNKGESRLDAAFRLAPEFRKAYDANPDHKELIDLAAALDGVARQTGIHAAGVLVADAPITDYGPLATRDGEVTTQYAMGDLTKLGMCKIDVLGLETLTLLRRAIDNVFAATGQTLVIDDFPLDDSETYAMLSRGDTKGVFQFESPGFRNLLSSMRPDRFDDLVAAVAMFRPGPMQYIDTYIARKHGREPVTHPHPLLGEILNETYGLAIYQEQVQALAQKLAGFSLSEGDLMRRAMGKKDEKAMESYRIKFVEGATPKVGEAIAQQVFKFIEPFAGYGFNKSHSACYALIAYQTAWLKCHYPREYMAALLTTNSGDSAKVAAYREDAQRMGIPVLPPSVNHSGVSFTVVDEGLRYGLTAVKGVGEKAVEGMAAERGKNGLFKSLVDLCERVDLRLLNKGALEAMIRAGAMDEFGERAALVAALEPCIAAGQKAQRDRVSGQRGLFGDLIANGPPPPLPAVPPWPPNVKLQFEKEVLGFYLSSHPLAEHHGLLRRLATDDTTSLTSRADRSDVIVGGMLSSVKFAVTRDTVDRKGNPRKGREYASFVMEDLNGPVQVMVFSDGNKRDPATGEVVRTGGRGFPQKEPLLENVRDLLVKDRMLVVVGQVDLSRDQPSIIADRIVPIEDAEEKLARSAILRLEAADVTSENLEALAGVCRAHGGHAQLLLTLRTGAGATVSLRADPDHGVRPVRALAEAVRTILGENRLTFGGRVP